MKTWQGVMMAVMVALAASGCRTLADKSKPATSKDARVIRAVRTDKPPVMDGKLDDAVWKKAEEISGFYFYNSDKAAFHKSFGRILYDDAHIYIGMKCLLPEGVKPVGEKHPHDSGKLFQEDIVEIMIDPGCTRSNYYQLAMNAYDSTFDCSRRQGGGHEDDGWNGEWVGKAHIGDGYYSVEMAIPFHNLGMTPDVGAAWGINLCREARNPAELSTMLKEATFNNAEQFAVLKGLNVDFRKYSFKIGPGRTVLEPSIGKAVAQLNMPITNLSGRKHKVRIDIHRAGPAGKDIIEKREVELANNASITLSLEKLAVKPVMAGHTDTYIIAQEPRTKKIVVSDAATSTVLSAALVRRPLFLEMMRVQVDDPWRADMSSRKTRAVSLTVNLSLPEAQLKKGSLVVTLTSRRTGKAAAIKAVKSPSSTTTVRFGTKAIPWGAYDARIAFKDARGQEVVATPALVTVLPGGPNHINPLNNLVSELMDAGNRGLIWDKEIEFMNPRDGWCFFSLSGAVSLWLDSHDKPFASARRGEKAIEAMRWLPAGRHRLHVEGQPEELVVRAIPELIYCYHQSNPHIAAHGPHDWKFLSKDVLPNCNLIIGSAYPDETRVWRAQGKRWLKSQVVPGLIEKEFASAEQSFKHWKKSDGYSHPLMDGIIADEFLTGASDEQYLAWTESILRLRQDPKFEGRLFYPWCGSVYSLPGGRIFMSVVHKFGWHHCFERYLPEQATEEAAWKYIHETLVASAKGWDGGIPGSVRKAVVTLGYMSHPTESLNTYATVNYKVYMDMQFETLARNPVFFGTYGIMEYTSSYADEETVRWAGKLYRHYCIEGRTERLSDDPYALTHVLNPDFYDGMKHWDVAAAETGSVTVKEHQRYGFLQCRYQVQGQGDVFLLMRRGAKKPNVISQTIRNLQPGRVYSLKMITGDYQDLVNEVSKKKMHAVSIKLDGVDILPGPKNSFQFIFPNNYSHVLGKFDRNYLYWMNYHWRVFRAKGPTAELTISDWKSNPSTGSGQGGPGGPVGQELIFNLIEVQPYLVD